ncbi:MAG: hypothetical protein Q9160_003551 [Pyrenula sp. 1 TL-2023]
MAKTMKAVDIKGGVGPASALFINPDTPIPTPKENEALIKIHAFGLNRADLLQREGKYPLPPHAPSTMGLEFSGTIISFGSSTPPPSPSPFAIGSRVLSLTPGGAYAEYITAPLRMLIPLPPSPSPSSPLTLTTAASIPEVFSTATQALYLLGSLTRGCTILFHAGASGVSLAGIQLAIAGGAKAVYVTAGTKEKVAFCEALGAGKAKGWCYREEERWDERVLESTGGRGVDVVVDFVGGGYFQRNLNAVARDGRVVVLGMLGGTKANGLEGGGTGGVDIGPLLWKRVRVEGSTLRSRDAEYQARLRDLVVEKAMPGLESGEFKCHVERVFGMSEIREAQELLESNRTMGKVVCVVD